jgi:glycosyltransferase involved in cell wall biosynthesis
MKSKSPKTSKSVAESIPELPPGSRKIFIVHPSSLLTDYQAHGDGLLSYRYICELAKRGHRVFVACEAVRLRDPLPGNVTVFPLVLTLQRFGVLRRVEYAWKMRRLFVRLNRTLNFDVAHQFNPVFAGLSLGLVGLDVPVVLGPYVAHWSFKRSSRAKTFVLDTISRIQQRFADGIVISGPAARARIISRSVEERNVFTVPYGIDLEKFPHEPIPEGDPVILYLAGLSAHKGITVLLAAFDILASRVPRVRLVVVGDGPYRNQAREIANGSAYQDRITFSGSIARQNVPAALASCTVYCLTSFGEPYGMSLVEAMAAGRPVVATNSGGPADLVDRRGGMLVAPGDVPALVAALEEIITNPDLARAMGAFNRDAMTAYTWPTVIDRLEWVYDNVISHRSHNA